MRRWALVTLLSAGLLLTSPAMAGADAATLSLSVTAAHVGDVVIASGSGYTAGPDTPPPVVLHWGTVDGPDVAHAVPDAKGGITTLFRVPDGQPGEGVVVAVQRNVAGADSAGTPARASLQVLPGPPVTPPSDAGTVHTAPLETNGFLAHSSGGPPPLLLAGGALLVVVGIGVLGGVRRRPLG